MIGRISNYKSAIFYILLSLFIVACQKSNEEISYDDLLNDGYYEGRFYYDGADFWYLLEINQNKYEEWPSGGVMFQQSLGCLTVGSYTIGESIITFILDSFKFEDPLPDTCVTDMILPGKYQLNYRDNFDSIVFSKETDSGTLIYTLKRKEIDN